MNTENISITRSLFGTYYDTQNLGLVIPKDKEAAHLVTIMVTRYRYKCVSISRQDALGLLTAMRQEHSNTNS